MVDFFRLIIRNYMPHSEATVPLMPFLFYVYDLMDNFIPSISIRCVGVETVLKQKK